MFRSFLVVGPVLSMLSATAAIASSGTPLPDPTVLIQGDSCGLAGSALVCNHFSETTPGIYTPFPAGTGVDEINVVLSSGPHHDGPPVIAAAVSKSYEYYASQRLQASLSYYFILRGPLDNSLDGTIVPLEVKAAAVTTGGYYPVLYGFGGILGGSGTGGFSISTGLLPDPNHPVVTQTASASADKTYPSSFVYDSVLDFVVGQIYRVDMFGGAGVSFTARPPQNAAVPGASGSLTLDPTITLVNNTPNVTLAFSAGIGGAAVSAVPEAATWTMMLAGLGVVGGALRRRQFTPATDVAPT